MLGREVPSHRCALDVPSSMSRRARRKPADPIGEFVRYDGRVAATRAPAGYIRME